MPPRLARGERVGERYLLRRELGKGSASVTWDALDERLDRPVALRIFDAAIDRSTIVKRAGIAASLTHPRVVRVFDTGEELGRFFTVSELLRESVGNVKLPLSFSASLQTALDVGEALTYAHERGVVHGHIKESNVLLSEGGAKLGDFSLSPESDHADRDEDLRAYGALLKRISGTPQPASPAGFNRIVEGLASGAYASAADALKDLRDLRPPAMQPDKTPRRRGWLVVAVALLLAAIAFGAMRLGERSPSQRFAPGGRIDGTPLSVVSVRDHDPLGDNRENPRTVGNVIDGDPQTFWSTERYSASADFSGLKEGVGIIFDLGERTAVGKAQFLFMTHGCSFEIRYADDPQAPVGEWATAATVADSPISAAVIFGEVEARYWLLWITQLTTGSPGAGRAYGCAVAEGQLFPP